jgi:hypothetical protein
MEQVYGTTADEAQVIRKRMEAMIKLVTLQLNSHPHIVGMCTVPIIADWYGREGLDDLIAAARDMRQTLINEEKQRARSSG